MASPGAGSLVPVGIAPCAGRTVTDLDPGIVGLAFPTGRAPALRARAPTANPARRPCNPDVGGGDPADPGRSLALNRSASRPALTRLEDRPHRD